MRIALFCPTWFAAPPRRYGGVEAVVHLLAEGLDARGVDVTLFASGDSSTAVPTISVFDDAPSDRIGQSFWELQHALAFLERRESFDLVHDHSGLLGLTLFGLTDSPVLHTVHGPLTGEPGRVYRKVTQVVPQAGLVSLTLNQRRPLPGLNWVANVPNAVDTAQFDGDREPEDFLFFLGRMSPDKGAHRAIEVARRTGRALKIAAKCREPAETAYFERHIEPHLDGQIEWLGEIGHDERREQLRRAQALLVPIEWEEPFGLAIVEAMASGTPVVAFRRGSVPELIRHGRTGFIVDDVEGMAAAVPLADSLDPDVLRGEVERRFSVPSMVNGYLDAYHVMLEHHLARADAPVPTARRQPGVELALREPQRLLSFDDLDS